MTGNETTVRNNLFMERTSKGTRWGAVFTFAAVLLIGFILIMYADGTNMGFVYGNV